MRVYLRTCRLLSGLKRTGFRQLVVLPESLADELEKGSSNDTDPAHVAAMAFYLGLVDMKAELYWAKGSQHPLLLDLYRKNKAQVSVPSSRRSPTFLLPSFYIFLASLIPPLFLLFFLIF